MIQLQHKPRLIPPTMLEELAERIEKLDGPDREVDGEIMCAIGSAQKRGNTLFRMHPEAGSTDVLVYTPTPFTASLDAAMTLVPEGASWEIRRAYPRPTVDGDRHTTAAAIWTPEYKRFADAAAIRARAETPALALCAAALRALAKEE